MFDPRKIRDLLDAQGRRVDWLAEITGYHRVSVSEFLNGKEPIPSRFAESTARALGVPLDWLRSEFPEPASVA